MPMDGILQHLAKRCKGYILDLLVAICYVLAKGKNEKLCYA